MDQSPRLRVPPAIGAEMMRELALAMVAALLVAGGRRDRSYLTAGRLDAPAAPVRWLITSIGWRTSP